MNSSTVIVFYFLLILANSTIQIDVGNLITRESCDESARYLKDKCQNFDQIKTLAQFRDFYEQFDQQNECLRTKASQLETLTESKQAEEICEQNGVLWASVRSFGQLLDRYVELKPICTIEYASKLYRLHNQLRQIDVEGKKRNLRDVLRSLANRVQIRCRNSLTKRLLSVERRAPDSVKYITVINGILNIGGAERVEKLSIEAEQFVPILSSELLPERMNSVALSAGGFEFKMTQQIKMALDSLKMSCKALQPYHVNILGSLGLLASIGYASRPEEVIQEPTGPIKRWLMSALLCQSLRGAMKMSQFTVDGKNLGRLKVLQLQEADVDQEMETDTEFETYNLPESKDSIEGLDSELPTDSYVYSNVSKLNLRKLQLLEGPNFRLANALYHYLDLTQKENRIEIPYAILGIEVPEAELKQGKSADEDDEEEE